MFILSWTDFFSFISFNFNCAISFHSIASWHCFKLKRLNTAELWTLAWRRRDIYVGRSPGRDVRVELTPFTGGRRREFFLAWFGLLDVAVRVVMSIFCLEANLRDTLPDTQLHIVNPPPQKNHVAVHFTVDITICRYSSLCTNIGHNSPLSTIKFFYSTLFTSVKKKIPTEIIQPVVDICSFENRHNLTSTFI